MSSRIVSDAPIAGLAQRLGAMGDVDADAAADELRDQALNAELPLPGGRGVPQVFDWIVAWIRGRRLVEDLGEHPAAVPWLTLHVPPDGSASLTLRHREQSEHGLKLTVIGSGYGSGRVVAVAVDETFSDRRQCVALSQHVGLHLRRYRGTVDGQELVEVAADVVRVRDLQITSLQRCPLCGTPTAELDPFEYEAAGRGVDLTRDDAGFERTETVSLTRRNEFEVTLPVSVPGTPQVKVGLIARRVLDLACESRLRFPGGQHFTPMRAISAQDDLPFWGLGPWPS